MSTRRQSPLGHGGSDTGRRRGQNANRRVWLPVVCILGCLVCASNQLVRLFRLHTKGKLAKKKSRFSGIKPPQRNKTKLGLAKTSSALNASTSLIRQNPDVNTVKNDEKTTNNDSKAVGNDIAVESLRTNDSQADKNAINESKKGHDGRVRTRPLEAVVGRKHNESEFDLTCDPSARAPGVEVGRDFDVAIFYHVGLLKNWKDVVRDQMHTLDTCGLGNLASSLTVSYSNGNRDELESVLFESRFIRENIKNITFMQSYGVPWEGPAMRAMYDHCTNITQQPQSTKPTLVYYFHNKGVSKYRQEWRDKFDNVWTYSRVYYWRKYLEYFLLERPQLCVHHLVTKGAKTCGVNFRYIGRWHYSGNFWATTCDYISQHTRFNGTGYVSAEMWLGEDIPKKNLDWSSFVSFHTLDTGLYKHLIVPQEYRFAAELAEIKMHQRS